jgi:hypothetical protein
MTAETVKKRGGIAEKVRDDEDPQSDSGGTGHGNAKSKKELDRQLDEQLEDTFPSSDPPAASQPTGAEPVGDPKAKP